MGKYGKTEAEFINRTYIICLIPKFNIEDDYIVYDEINLEIWHNGIDFIEVGKNYIERTKN